MIWNANQLNYSPGILMLIQHWTDNGEAIVAVLRFKLNKINYIILLYKSYSLKQRPTIPIKIV